ncbi:MAG: hypothetical protein KKG32_05565, partial [Alphaproteobacteria bacterium]|nr:hypothetical protein [Alphaproteobacteria bacterium]
MGSAILFVIASRRRRRGNPWTPLSADCDSCESPRRPALDCRVAALLAMTSGRSPASRDRVSHFRRPGLDPGSRFPRCEERSGEAIERVTSRLSDCVGAGRQASVMDCRTACGGS